MDGSTLRYCDRRRRGFTVIELVLVAAITALLSGFALSTYRGYIDRARTARAVAEIASIAVLLDTLNAEKEFTLPPSLASLALDSPNDPWGNPYQYLLLQGQLPAGIAGAPDELPAVAAAGGMGGGGGGAPAIAHARKDGFLVPINSDYDLYSVGTDGQSKPTLHAPVSRDDVIRAADGAYIGIAELY